MPPEVALTLPYAAAHGDPLADVGVAMLDGATELMLAEAQADAAAPVQIATLVIGAQVLHGGLPIGLTRAAALTLGDREVALRAIHTATFGALGDVCVDCPACGTGIECALDLTTLTAAVPSGDRSSGRMPTGADLAAATDGIDVLTLCGISDEADIARRDPNAECAIVLVCPDCGYGFTALLDAMMMLIDTVRNDGGILADIDMLARSYAWSEQAILALPRARRRRYCTMIATSDRASGRTSALTAARTT